MYKEDRQIAGVNIEQKLKESMKVPENYFDELQGKLENLADDQSPQSVRIIPIWLKVAAVAITCCLSIWLLNQSNTTNAELAVNQVTWEDYDEFVGMETDDLILLDDLDETLTLLENEMAQADYD